MKKGPITRPAPDEMRMGRIGWCRRSGSQGGDRAPCRSRSGPLKVAVISRGREVTCSNIAASGEDAGIYRSCSSLWLTSSRTLALHAIEEWGGGCRKVRPACSGTGRDTSHRHGSLHSRAYGDQRALVSLRLSRVTAGACGSEVIGRNRYLVQRQRSAPMARQSMPSKGYSSFPILRSSLRRSPSFNKCSSAFHSISII